MVIRVVYIAHYEIYDHTPNSRLQSDVASTALFRRAWNINARSWHATLSPPSLPRKWSTRDRENYGKLDTTAHSMGDRVSCIDIGFGFTRGCRYILLTDNTGDKPNEYRRIGVGSLFRRTKRGYGGVADLSGQIRARYFWKCRTHCDHSGINRGQIFHST
jgi:hypothetical protein